MPVSAKSGCQKMLGRFRNGNLPIAHDFRRPTSKLVAIKVARERAVAAPTKHRIHGDRCGQRGLDGAADASRRDWIEGQRCVPHHQRRRRDGTPREIGRRVERTDRLSRRPLHPDPPKRTLAGVPRIAISMSPAVAQNPMGPRTLSTRKCRPASELPKSNRQRTLRFARRSARRSPASGQIWRANWFRSPPCGRERDVVPLRRPADHSRRERGLPIGKPGAIDRRSSMRLPARGL